MREATRLLIAFRTRRAALLLVLGFAMIVVLGAIWTQSLVAEFAGPITPAGHHDFFALYSAATLVHAHRAGSLYDAGALTAIERQIYAHPTGYAGYMPFINPPSAAALLTPLALLSEGSARLVWLLVSIGLAVACALVLTAGRARLVRVAAVLVVLAGFPAYQTFTEGQWSFVMLLGCLGALSAHRRGHRWLAGAALAALWLKPPLFLLVLVWLLLRREWRVLGGMVGTVAVVTAATLPLTGMAVNFTYARYLTSVLTAHVSGAGAVGQTAWEGALPNMEGLIGLAASIFGQQHPAAVDAATLGAAVALTGYFVWAMRGRWRQPRLAVRYTLAAVALGLLLDPHLYAQDCVLLLVLAALVLAEISRRVPRAVATRSLAVGRLELGVILGAGALMDLSAIDTLWISDPVLKPVHLLTFVLIAAVLGLAWAGIRRPRVMAAAA